MPLVLAVAPNGAITGGFPLKLTEQDVAGAFVSPGTAGCLKAMQARKLVLLCVLPAGETQIARRRAGVRGGHGLRPVHRGGDGACRRRRRGRLPEVPEDRPGDDADGHGDARCPPARMVGSFPGAGDEGPARREAQGGPEQLLPRRQVRAGRLLPAHGGPGK